MACRILSFENAVCGQKNLLIFPGHGTLIGSRQGKVLSYSVRSKTCRVCELAEKKKKPPKTHRCYRNWQGSAKAMEPDMAVEMVRNIVKEGTKVAEIIMDDDTTTIHRIQSEVDETITKRTDRNHICKRFTNQLYHLQNKHSSMRYNVIKYLERMFKIALSQNQDNPEGLEAALEAIVPHAFGCHDKCNPEWCGAKSLDDPSTYRYKGLPRHRALKGEDMKKDLLLIFSKYTTQADKLAHLGSSQANESLNSSISKKAPKSSHLSASGALYNRVSAAVAEKNIGSSYVSKVFNISFYEKLSSELYKS